MRALRWHGKHDIRCDTVPDPKIENPRDANIRVTNCTICGSDLHLYDGFMPTMESGDIMSHEFMGEVVEVGPDAKGALKVGDRIVVPFTIIYGECDQCKRGNFSVCERSNRNKDMADKMFGHATAGLFGVLMNKRLTLRTGQTHVNRWTDDLLRRIDEGQIDPSFVITHTVDLAKGPEMYKTFRDKQDGCIKVVLKT